MKKGKKIILMIAVVLVVAVVAVLLLWGPMSKQYAKKVYSTVQANMHADYERVYGEYYFASELEGKLIDGTRDFDAVKEFVQNGAAAEVDYDSIEFRCGSSGAVLSVSLKVNGKEYVQSLIGQRIGWGEYYFDVYKIAEKGHIKAIAASETAAHAKVKEAGEIDKDLYKAWQLEGYKETANVVPGDYYLNGEKGGDFYRFYEDGTYTQAETKWLDDETMIYTGEVSDNPTPYLAAEITAEGNAKGDIVIIYDYDPTMGEMYLPMTYDGDKKLGDYIRIEE